MRKNLCFFTDLKRKASFLNFAYRIRAKAAKHTHSTNSPYLFLSQNNFKRLSSTCQICDLLSTVNRLFDQIDIGFYRIKTPSPELKVT